MARQWMQRRLQPFVTSQKINLGLYSCDVVDWAELVMIAISRPQLQTTPAWAGQTSGKPRQDKTIPQTLTPPNCLFRFALFLSQGPRSSYRLGIAVFSPPSPLPAPPLGGLLGPEVPRALTKGKSHAKQSQRACTTHCQLKALYTI